MSPLKCPHSSWWWGCPFTVPADLLGCATLTTGCGAPRGCLGLCTSAAPWWTASSFYLILEFFHIFTLWALYVSLLPGLFYAWKWKFNPTWPVCSRFNKMSKSQAVRHGAAACVYSLLPGWGRTGHRPGPAQPAGTSAGWLHSPAFLSSPPEEVLGFRY